MTLRHFADDRQKVSREQRDWQACLLGGRPQPVHCAVGPPGALVGLEQGKAEADHAWAVFPTIWQGATFGTIEWEVAEDGEPVRVLAGGLDGDVVAIGIPAGWMQHR